MCRVDSTPVTKPFLSLAVEDLQAILESSTRPIILRIIRTSKIASGCSKSIKITLLISLSWTSISRTPRIVPTITSGFVNNNYPMVYRNCNERISNYVHPLCYRYMTGQRLIHQYWERIVEINCRLPTYRPATKCYS